MWRKNEVVLADPSGELGVCRHAKRDTFHSRLATSVTWNLFRTGTESCFRTIFAVWFTLHTHHISCGWTAFHRSFVSPWDVFQFPHLQIDVWMFCPTLNGCFPSLLAVALTCPNPVFVFKSSSSSKIFCRQVHHPHTKMNGMWCRMNLCLHQLHDKLVLASACKTQFARVWCSFGACQQSFFDTKRHIKQSWIWFSCSSWFCASTVKILIDRHVTQSSENTHWHSLIFLSQFEDIHQSVCLAQSAHAEPCSQCAIEDI